MIDPELLVFTLLEAGKPDGWTIEPETDSESLDDLPLLTFNIIGDGQSSNGPGLYTVTLDLSVFTEGIDAAKAGAGVFYDLVHQWDENPITSIVDGVGWVQSVDDISLFSRMGTPEVTGHNVSQYAGSFALALRN